jgi:hypothetical protein
VQQQFAETSPQTAVPYLWGAAKCAVCRDRPRAVSGLETAITACIRNISQADLQKVFGNKFKRVQACIDARGHHFQQFLEVHSEFPNAYLQKMFANKIKRVQVRIDVRRPLPSKKVKVTL